MSYILRKVCNFFMEDKMKNSNMKKKVSDLQYFGENHQSESSHLEKCYYIPEIMFEKPFSSYSSEAKILLGITMSMAENATSIMEVAEILNKLGNETVSAIYTDLQKTKARGEA